jgi:hypothetical protein
MGKANPPKKLYRIVLQTVEKFPSEDGTWRPIYGLANLEYENVGDVKQNLDKGLFIRSIKEFCLVDWNQEQCIRSNRCKLANCLGRIESGYPNCLTAGDLGFPDKHNETDILKQRVYSASEFEEHFISMNQVTKIDGFSYRHPDQMPYYGKFSSCDDALCNKEAVAEGRAECSCFYYKKFALGKIIQLVVYNMGPTIEGKPGREIPFHLHSTHFFLVKWAPPIYTSNGTIKEFNKDIYCEDPEVSGFRFLYRSLLGRLLQWSLGQQDVESR